MAYRLFQGANWEAASFAPASIPVDGDEVVIPEGISHNKTDTGSPGLANDTNLALLKTHRGFSGDFGSSGAPIQTAADLVIHEGSGAFYYECNDIGTPNFTTDEVRIQAANSGVIVVLGTDSGATLGDFTKIVVNRGHLTLKSGIKFSGTPKVIVGSIGNIANDATLIIAAGAPTLGELLQQGGLATTHNVVTDLRIHAGIHFKESAAATNVDLVGGTLVYNHGAAAGDVVLIEVHAGATLDFMRSAVTVGAGVRRVIDKVIAHPGSRVLYDPETTTITTFEDYRTGLQ